MANYAGLVLAAGAGHRLGLPEATLEYRGRILIDRAVAALREGGCRQVLAVLGAQAERVLAASNELFTPVLNRRWGQGLSTSLRAGLAAMPDRYDGAVLTLVDQPRIASEAVRRLIEAASDGASLAVTTYDGEHGHPMLFGREHFDRIAATAKGDRGVRDFLAADRSVIREVPCPGGSRDVEPPAGRAALVRR